VYSSRFDHSPGECFDMIDPTDRTRRAIPDVLALGGDCPLRARGSTRRPLPSMMMDWKRGRRSSSSRRRKKPEKCERKRTARHQRATAASVTLLLRLASCLWLRLLPRPLTWLVCNEDDGCHDSDAAWGLWKRRAKPDDKYIWR